MVPSTLSVDGGGGTDTLYVTFPATNDQVTLSADDTNPATTDVTDDLWMDYQLKGAAASTAKHQTIFRVEHVSIDLGAGSDSLLVHDLHATPTQSLTVDLGRISTVNGTRQETITGSSFTHEVPDVRYSDDRAADTVTVEGSDTGADTFRLRTGTPTTGPAKGIQATRLTTSFAYGVDVVRGVRSEGDTFVVDTLGGGDTINASPGTTADPGVTADLVALVLRSGAGNDTIIGSSYNDAVDSGLGDDIVTGGDGTDSFADAGGSDTLVESFDRDFFLSDGLLVIGTVLGRTPGTGFASGTVESLLDPVTGLPIFETARLTGGAGNNTFLVGDLDGVLAVPGGSRPVRGWHGTAYVDAQGGDDLVVVATRDSSGSTVDVTAGSGTDALVVDGTSFREDVVIGRNSAGTRDQITSAEWSPSRRTPTTIVHDGLDSVLVRTGDSGDRVLVRSVSSARADHHRDRVRRRPGRSRQHRRVHRHDRPDRQQRRPPRRDRRGARGPRRHRHRLALVRRHRRHHRQHRRRAHPLAADRTRPGHRRRDVHRPRVARHRPGLRQRPPRRDQHPRRGRPAGPHQAHRHHHRRWQRHGQHPHHRRPDLGRRRQRRQHGQRGQPRADDRGRLAGGHPGAPRAHRAERQRHPERRRQRHHDAGPDRRGRRAPGSPASG